MAIERERGREIEREPKGERRLLEMTKRRTNERVEKRQSVKDRDENDTADR